MRCATKQGTLRVRTAGGEEYILDTNGLDLPDDLAESIRGNVNVVVVDAGPVEPERARPRRGRGRSDESSETTEGADAE